MVLLTCTLIKAGDAYSAIKTPPMNRYNVKSPTISTDDKMSVVIVVMAWLDKDGETHNYILSTDEFRKLHFLRTILSEEELDYILKRGRATSKETMMEMVNYQISMNLLQLASK